MGWSRRDGHREDHDAAADGEQICAAGVPVFATDSKGDLSGIASPGQPNQKRLSRTVTIGQDW